MEQRIYCVFRYKGNLIKEYFKNFDFYNEDIKVDLKSGKIIGNKKSRGLESAPCRYWSKYNDRKIKRVKKLLNDQDFCLLMVWYIKC